MEFLRKPPLRHEMREILFKFRRNGILYVEKIPRERFVTIWKSFALIFVCLLVHQINHLGEYRRAPSVSETLARKISLNFLSTPRILCLFVVSNLNSILKPPNLQVFSKKRATSYLDPFGTA